MNNDFYYMLVTPTPPFNIFIENCNFIRKKNQTQYLISVSLILVELEWKTR